MTDQRTPARRHRRATADAAKRGGRGKLRTWPSKDADTPPEGWPNQDGTLNLSGANLKAGAKVTTPGSKRSNGSQLPHLPRLQRALPPTTSGSQPLQSSQSWRSLKSVDIVSFNAGAEAHFVLWLTAKIRASEGQAVGMGWVYSNAAFELDISIETVKRYLLKHTADLAEFHSNGKFVTLRDDNPF